MFVLTNVILVLTLLITVLNVKLQESMSQLVLAQMDTSITVTLVSVVLTNVLLVLPEKTVLPVLMSELTLQIVNVHPDIMILVKPNVKCVTGNVKLVNLTTFVTLVLTKLEWPQLVIVHKVGWMLKTVLLVVKKNHIQKD
jgi:hypothetical protein